MSMTNELPHELSTIREIHDVKRASTEISEHNLRGPNSQTPTPCFAMSIAMIDEYRLTRECIVRSLKQLDGTIQIASFLDCEDYLQDLSNYEVSLYYAHSRDEWRTVFESISARAPVIILADFDSPDLIIDALENGVRGYIPIASTAPELVIEIIRLVRAGGTFAPVNSLGLRKADQQGVPTTTTAHDLTPRQIAVLHQLKLGKANKIIAYELEMSESTVKVHIRNIMKKMNARNRTEVACRAYGLANVGLRLAGDRFQMDTQADR
jgi:DNA-binding NarL/FixJ family response regulator